MLNCVAPTSESDDRQNKLSPGSPEYDFVASIRVTPAVPQSGEQSRCVPPTELTAIVEPDAGASTGDDAMHIATSASGTLLASTHAPAEHVKSQVRSIVGSQ